MIVWKHDLTSKNSWVEMGAEVKCSRKMFPQNAPTLPTPKPGTAIVNAQIIFYFFSFIFLSMTTKILHL